MKKLIFLFLLVLCSAAFSARITLVYTNNFNGMIKSCGCPGNELGGIAYAATYLEQLRSTLAHDYLLLDAGDFLPMKDWPINAKYTLLFLRSMKYDAINIGDQDFWFGTDYLKNETTRNQLPIVSASVAADSAFVFPPYRIRQFDWGKAVMVGILDQSLFQLVDAQKMGTWSFSAQSELAGILNDPNAQAQLVIVLCHAPIPVCQKIAAANQNIDIMISGHEQKIQTEPIRVNDTYIVQAGRYGEYLGVLEVEMAEGKVMRASDLSIPVVPVPTLEPQSLDSLFNAFEDENKVAFDQIDLTAVQETRYLHKNADCIACHFDQGRQFETSLHASSYNTLVQYKSENNLECLECHTTAFKKPGGFQSLTHTPFFRNVGCIACHQDLADADMQSHAREPKNAATVSETVCRTCHTAQWSPNFEFHKYRKYVTHEIRTITVTDDDWLSKLSEKYYGSADKWQVIYEANKYSVENADKIFPGQKLVIPKVPPGKAKSPEHR